MGLRFLGKEQHEDTGLVSFSQRRRRAMLLCGCGNLLGRNAITSSLPGPGDKGSGQKGFTQAGASLRPGVGRIMPTLHHCFEHKYREVGSSWEKVFCVCWGQGGGERGGCFGASDSSGARCQKSPLRTMDPKISAQGNGSTNLCPGQWIKIQKNMGFWKHWLLPVSLRVTSHLVFPGDWQQNS